MPEEVAPAPPAPPVGWDDLLHPQTDPTEALPAARLYRSSRGGLVPVRCATQSLRAGEVFVLDAGSKLFLYVDAKSRPIQRLDAAKQLQTLVMSPERSAMPPTVVLLDESFWKKHSKGGDFWSILEDGGSTFADEAAAKNAARSPGFPDLLLALCAHLPLLHCAFVVWFVDALAIAGSAKGPSAGTKRRYRPIGNRGAKWLRQNMALANR